MFRTCSRFAISSLALLLLAAAAAAQPVGTAFTYQGDLRANGVAVNAPHDFRFRLYDAPTNGQQLGPTVDVAAVAVSEGQFTALLDFGPGQFAGDAQWLEVAVRPAGTGSYETLAPRTPITATPYALGAVAALANAVTGTSVVDGSIAGTDLAAGTIGAREIDPAAVQARIGASCPPGQSIRAVAATGDVTCQVDTDTDTGVDSVVSGGGVTGTINGRTLQLGSDATVQRRSAPTPLDCPAGQYLRSVAADGTPSCASDQVGTFSGWGLSGNAGTSPATNFLGTTDATPLVLRTGNAPSLRLEPSAATFNGAPATANVIAGSSANSVAAGVKAATIAGGGVPDGYLDPLFSVVLPNVVTADYATIGGGAGNRAGAEPANTGGWFATVAGGEQNTASGNLSVIGGGVINAATGSLSAILGGSSNGAMGQVSVVGGGRDNCAGADRSWVGGTQAKTRPWVNVIDNPALGCGGIPTSPDFGGDEGTFVWADSRLLDFISTGQDQFLVRAAGGAVVQRAIGSEQLARRPRGLFNVVGGDSGIAQPASPAASTLATFESNGNNYVRLLAPDVSERGVLFGDPVDQADGGIVYNGSNDLQFRTNGNTLRMTVGGDGALTLVSGTAIKAGGGTWAAPSDARLKRAIEPLSGALDALLGLHGVRFEYAEPDGGVLPAGRHIGFIAQQVREVFPDWVGESAQGYLTVGPTGFEALAVEALRELREEGADRDLDQASRLAALEAENRALHERLAALEARLAREP